MRLRSYQENIRQLVAHCREQKSLALVEDEVLLATYIQYFSRRKDTRALCKRMLTEAGSLYHLVHLPPHHLENAFGINKILATAISNIGTSSDYAQMQTKPRQQLKLLPEYYQHLRPYFSAANFEKTVIVCLNRQYGWIATEVSTFYHATQTPAVATLVLEIAQKNHARHVVIAHNHPSTGVHQLMPSTSDLTATENIRRLLVVYGITLQDHVLVAYDGCLSLMHDNIPRYLDPTYYPYYGQPEFLFDPDNFK